MQQLGSPALLRSSLQLVRVVVRMSASPVPHAVRMHSPRPKGLKGRVAGLHLTDERGKGEAVINHCVETYCL